MEEKNGREITAMYKILHKSMFPSQKKKIKLLPTISDTMELDI
jgi:hypothetical protein